MEISTDPSYTGVIEDHPHAAAFTVLGYADGAVTLLAKDCFRGWYGQDVSEENWTFHIGRGSQLGAGSTVRQAWSDHVLRIGNWTAIGQRCFFQLAGQHRMNTAAIADFANTVWPRVKSLEAYPAIASTTITVEHDVWIGDDAYFLPGCTISTGSVIGARSLVPMNLVTEPYGIYVGSPARLVRFRFPAAVREALLDLAWWELPVPWLAEHHELFMSDLAGDEVQALDTLAALEEKKREWLAGSVA